MRDRSQPEVAQRGMIVGPATRRPMVFPRILADRQIVDAGDAEAHQSVLVEFPVFVTVAPEPVAAVVVPLISKAHCNPVLAKRPELLDQPVVQLSDPFPRQERFDSLAALKEFGAIAPAA